MIVKIRFEKGQSLQDQDADPFVDNEGNKYYVFDRVTWVAIEMGSDTKHD